MGTYDGYDDTRIGVVPLGDCAAVDDDTVSADVLISTLAHDMSKVKSSIESHAYEEGPIKGDQAFALPENMFLLGDRNKSMSAVVTLTDGKAWLLVNVSALVMRLTGKRVQLIFARSRSLQVKNSGLRSRGCARSS